jgi:helix-turn-helix, Psq domain
MPQINEQAIQQVLQDLSTGKITSIRAAAAAYDVNRNTLSNRMKGMLTRTEVRQDQLLLSSA